MRKITLSILVTVFMAFTLPVQSQTAFPDGGFENCWQEFTTSPELGEKPYWDLKSDYFLSTLNLLYDLGTEQGEAPLTAYRLESADAHTGNHAIKVISKEMIMGNTPLFLPGVTGTLAVDIGGMACDLGKPFTSRPTAIKGWYKYEPVNGDSAAIEVILQDDDFQYGRGKQVFRDKVDTWTEFTVPITYSYEQTPNTIVVLFVASNKYDFTNIQTLMACKGQIGSTLCLDDVEFEYGPTGIKEMLAPEISVNVFPNPSSEQVTIQIGKETNGTIMVYDYLSRKVGEYPVNGTQTTINISGFATGSYLINVVEKEKVITTGRFVKQ
jgi:hypothetical protein